MLYHFSDNIMSSLLTVLLTVLLCLIIEITLYICFTYLGKHLQHQNNQLYAYSYLKILLKISKFEIYLTIDISFAMTTICKKCGIWVDHDITIISRFVLHSSFHECDYNDCFCSEEKRKTGNLWQLESVEKKLLYFGEKNKIYY